MREQLKARALSLGLYALLFAYLLYWLWVKFTLFNRLAYTSDILRFTQASLTWLQGLPLLYEYNRGSGSHLHNNFIVLLFAPLTRVCGAYGLMIGTWLAYLAAGAAWLRRSLRSQQPAVAMILAAFVFGPVAFWLWDDPIYGWHPEVLYPPLALLMLLALADASRWFWLWAALLVLVRQDGALVGLGVHCSYLLISGAAPRRVLPSAGAWLLVFLAGMGMLYTFAPAGAARTNDALSAALQALAMPAERRMLSGMLHDLALMLAPFSVVLLCRRGMRTLLVGACAMLPLLAVTLIAAIAYLPDTVVFQEHGATWGPRVALFWSCGSAALLLAAERTPGRRGVLCGAAALVVGLALQAHTLQLLRHYPLLERFSAPFSRDYPEPQLGAHQRALLRCLAKALPFTATVSGCGGMEAFFHRHILIWPEDLAPERKPALVACAEHLPFQYGCGPYLETLGPPDYERHSLYSLHLAVSSEYRRVLQSCRQPQRLPRKRSNKRRLLQAAHVGSS